MREMTEEEERLRNVLRHFTCTENYRTLSRVCIKGGFAYASDGRIAVKWEMDDPPEDDVLDGFPVDRIDKILNDAMPPESWCRMDMAKCSEVEKLFLEEYREERSKAVSDNRDRYKRCCCPSCGEDLCWDAHSDSLVEESEMESPDIPTVRDITYPVRFVFGEEPQEKTYVNFGFILTVVKTLGEDVMFGQERAQNDKRLRLIVFKSKDGKASGVLMPLRVEGADGSEHEIRMVQA